MTIAYNAAGSIVPTGIVGTYTAGSPYVSGSFTPSATGLVIATVTAAAGANVTVTDSLGSTFSLITSYLDPGGVNYLSVFYCASPVTPGVARTYKMWTTTGATRAICVIDISGSAGSAYDGFNGGVFSGTAPPANNSITTTQASDLVLQFIASGQTGTATYIPHNAFAANALTPSGTTELGAAWAVVAAGSYDPAWTFGDATDYCSVGGVAIVGGSGGGSTSYYLSSDNYF